MAEYRPPTPERPLAPENSYEHQVERPEYTEQQLEQQRQQEQEGLEQQADQARRHMAEMIEEQKSSAQTVISDDDNTDLTHVPKKEKSFTAWLEHLPEKERVPVSKKLILTKGKKLVDVIHAFLLLEDFSSLDQLEEELSESYDDLVANGIVPDLRRK